MFEWFRKKKEEKKEEVIPEKKLIPDFKDEKIYTEFEVMYDEHAVKRLEMYSIPGVDRVDIAGAKTHKQSGLIRRTQYMCPKCLSPLYNTKLNGIHYYCPNCKFQYRFSKEREEI